MLRKNKLEKTSLKINRKSIKKLFSVLEKINTFFLDALFPIACLACGKKDVWLCEKCVGTFSLSSFQLCPYCEYAITENGKICERCKKQQFEKNSYLPLSALICATDYQRIAKFVHLFKYNFVIDLGAPLGKIIAKALQKNNLPLPDLIIPIPIHKRKLKWRGFNQAEILANSVSQNLTPGLPLPVRTDLVFRQKKTKVQMKIKNYHERLANLRDAFAIRPARNTTHSVAGGPQAENTISGKKILLIDDVATTGATLFECAKILKAAGAKEVTGAIIARQKI
ncbi:MAG: phosphoribosyltransferase family protein [Candidatus Moranbacteria bacterium]|nr:phosphoribosyltransferase family protein [Candidatus Moranbacteria bacterium]